MLFLLTSLSKLPSRRVSEISIIMMRAEVLSRSTVKFSEHGTEHPQQLVKRINMLKLGTENSQYPKGLQTSSLFCNNNAIHKYMSKFKF